MQLSSRPYMEYLVLPIQSLLPLYCMQPYRTSQQQQHPFTIHRTTILQQGLPGTSTRYQQQFCLLSYYIRQRKNRTPGQYVLELIKVLHTTNFYTAAAVGGHKSHKCNSEEQGYCIIAFMYIVGSLVLSSISMTQNSNEMTGLPYTTIAIKEIN